MSSIKRQPIDLKTKLDILKDLENGLKVKEVSKKYNKKATTIYKLKKDKNKIEDYVSIQFNSVPDKKRMRSCAMPELESKLYSWFLNQRDSHNIISDEMIQAKAKEIFETLENPRFKSFEASACWLSKFKKRHGIRLLTISGEILSCDESLIPDFLAKLNRIMRENNYLPEHL